MLSTVGSSFDFNVSSQGVKAKAIPGWFVPENHLDHVMQGHRGIMCILQTSV